MAIAKHICRCGAKVDKLTSYFSNGIRVTVCDQCAELNKFKNNNAFIAVDYDEVKNDANMQIIDTREK